MIKLILTDEITQSQIRDILKSHVFDAISDWEEETKEELLKLEIINEYFGFKYKKKIQKALKKYEKEKNY